MNNLKTQIGLVLSASLFGALLTAALLIGPDAMRTPSHAQDATGLQRGGAAGAVATQDLAAAQDLSSAFRNVANLLRPSVVSINTTQTQMVRARGLEGLFGAPAPPQRRESSGMGSGVIVRADGYILTNNHVVQDAQKLEVELADGIKVPGKIIGTDPQSDLAVVKIDMKNLPAVPMGNSDAIQVGDWVLAIGSPFGLDQTVTAGIISGKNRVRGIVGDGDGFEDFLQTDAAINPGNSGGPLVNLRGELVGINTAIMSRSGSSAGIGFAIPVSIANPVLNSIIKHGVAKRGFLGAGLNEINEETVAEYNIAVKRGVVIEEVLKGMPADRAGLKTGDVVVSIDGRMMTTSSQMRNYVASRPPGATMKLDVNRGGKLIPVRVELTERTEDAMAQFRSAEVMGALLVPVTPSTAAKYGYPEDQKGLIVTKITVGSVAEEAELKVGDIIESAQRIALDSAQKLMIILEDGRRRRQTINIVVRRGNERMLLQVGT